MIHACFKTATGALRVIDDSTQSCDRNETALNWKQHSVSGWELKLVDSQTDSTQKSVLVDCPPGKKLLGRGARIFPGLEPIALTISAPAFPGTWIAEAREMIPTDADWHLEGYAICARVDA